MKLKAIAPVLFVCAASGAVLAQAWALAVSQEQMLPESTDCWEPALAAGPNGRVYVVAGRRHGAPKDKDFDQQQVIWRSANGGKTFEAPRPVSTEGSSHYDQRIAVDEKGTIYVSYMDAVRDANGRRSSRPRLALSHDEGRTFTAQTVTTYRVSDKPELAISRDGRDVYIAYESGQGPIIVASHDGAAIGSDDRLHAAWCAGEPGYRTGTIWVNSIDTVGAVKR